MFYTGSAQLSLKVRTRATRIPRGGVLGVSKPEGFETDTLKWPSSR